MKCSCNNNNGRQLDDLVVTFFILLCYMLCAMYLFVNRINLMTTLYLYTHGLLWRIDIVLCSVRVWALGNGLNYSC